MLYELPVSPDSSDSIPLDTAKFFTPSIVFAQMYQFSLNLSSLQQKFKLMSNYLGTNSAVVKRFDCIWINYVDVKL